MEAAALLQQYTGRLTCRHAKTYKGLRPPKCKPLCEACLRKWLEMQ